MKWRWSVTTRRGWAESEVTIILDVNKRRLSKKRVISISGVEGTIDIAKNLPPDAYNLDPEALF